MNYKWDHTQHLGLPNSLSKSPILGNSRAGVDFPVGQHPGLATEDMLVCSLEAATARVPNGLVPTDTPHGANLMDIEPSQHSGAGAVEGSRIPPVPLTKHHLVGHSGHVADPLPWCRDGRNSAREDKCMMCLLVDSEEDPVTPGPSAQLVAMGWTTTQDHLQTIVLPPTSLTTASSSFAGNNLIQKVTPVTLCGDVSGLPLSQLCLITNEDFHEEVELNEGKGSVKGPGPIILDPVSVSTTHAAGQNQGPQSKHSCKFGCGPNQLNGLTFSVTHHLLEQPTSTAQPD
ncbi:hypothetical protein DFH28DRAFT_1125747 [Melampsora americana]|nr:hypothetical protein DFH28DRAFT_1125747 [Melampsora americana]